MTKGVAIKFKSYQETVPALLSAIKLDSELKKHTNIILKPNLTTDPATSTPAAFVEAVVAFCAQHKNAGAEVLIAEGAEGNTQELFDTYGYKELAEKYGVGLIDLNQADCEEIRHTDFLAHESIMYPKLLKEGFIISLPLLAKHTNHDMTGSLATMRGAYPSKHYKGWFSREKNKIQGPHKHQIHDILVCGMPHLALIDAHEQGYVLVGQPLDVDKQAAKLLGLDWRSVGHLRVSDERFNRPAAVFPHP